MVRYNWSVCQQSRNEQNLTFDPKFNIFAKEKQQKEQPDFSSLKQAEGTGINRPVLHFKCKTQFS